MDGIIMTADSVRGVLDGRKTKTRRAIKPQPDFAQYHVHKGTLLYECENRTWCWKNHISPDSWNEIDWLVQFAPYQPGDILYIKEAWRLTDYQYIDGVWSASVQYKADMTIGPRLFWPDGSENGYDRTGWRSPMFMPRAAARIFLRVTDVRVERVQEISEEDAVAEGCLGDPCKHLSSGQWGCEDCMNTGWLEPPQLEFMERWESLNSKRDGGIYAWAANPFCWAYTFERISKEEAEMEDAA